MNGLNYVAGENFGRIWQRSPFVPKAFLIMVCLLWSLWNSGIALSQQEIRTGEAVQSKESVSKEQGQGKLTEERIRLLEKTLSEIKNTGEKSESRSFDNKMMSLELIRYVRIMVIVLVVIAVAFPVTTWVVSRKKVQLQSGTSSDLAETLLVIEERQTKLAGILRDLQSEIDYLHTMSAPDLKNLISQAEKYLKQNEIDLKGTHSNKHEAKLEQSEK
jgi:hypothetical protein